MVCPECKTEIKGDVSFCPHCGSDIIKESNRNILLFLASIGNLVVVLPLIMMGTGIWGIFGAFGDDGIAYYGILILFVLYGVGSLVFLVSSIARLLRPKNKEKTIISEIVKLLVIIAFVVVTIAIIISLIIFF